MTAAARPSGPDDDSELREALAAEMARHRDVIQLVNEDPADPWSGEFRYGCTCGHERGIYTEREAHRGLASGELMDAMRLHIAAAILPVIAEHTRRAVADELEAAADELHLRRFDADDDTAADLRRPDSFYAGIVHARIRLRARAAALRGEQRGE